MTSRLPLRKVALLFESTNAYARTLLIGIGEYMLSHEPWSVHFAELGPNDNPPDWLKGWRGNGVIVRGESRRLARAVDKLRLPTIDLTPSRLLRRAPWVKSDDAMIARCAAQHFFERGFRQFGFCGDARFNWSDLRGAQFTSQIRSGGCECHAYSPRRPARGNDEETDEVARWLRALPKPVAVFACYDNRGQQVLEACRRAGLAVPETVAVLGVDNDDVLCALSPPPMSSVILNPRRAGWEAAALLSRLMNGEAVPAEPHLIPPVGIATRQSTDILAVPDAKISAALSYIREHACEGIRVHEVVRRVPMARRALEMRFRKLLGRSPHEEILRVQLNRAKELLVGTELPVWEIAGRVGFEPDYLSVVFKKKTGLAPSDYRKRHSRPR